MKRCAVTVCPAEIVSTKIMCSEHWSAVPRDLKLHIWVLCETGYGPGTTPWQSAVAAASKAAGVRPADALRR